MKPNPYEPVHIEPAKPEHPLWLVLLGWYLFPFVMIVVKFKLNPDWAGLVFEIPTVIWLWTAILGPMAVATFIWYWMRTVS